jgi:mono/diheme cytochrome c family protein
VLAVNRRLMKNRVLVLLLFAALPLAPVCGAAQEMRSSNSGVYTQGQADRGHQLYVFRCARCHDVGFSDAPAFSSARFTGDFTGKTLFDMADLIRNSMPLDKPGTTTKADAADLTAYILSVMEAPPGADELPAEDAVLRQIRIDPK